MTLENICNEDMLVNFSNNAGPPDLIYTGDQSIDLVKVVPTLSTKCKALGKKVATTSVVITWTLATGGCAYTSATHSFVSGAAAIPATALKVKAEGQFVLREGDDAAPAGCVGSWLDPISIPVPCQCDTSISNAGQTKAKAQ